MKRRAVLLAVAAVLLILTGCAGSSYVNPGGTGTSVPTLTPCALEPVIVPTLPAEIPGYAELDETTGLHVTGEAVEVDLDTYRLEVVGAVFPDAPGSYWAKWLVKVEVY